MEGLNALVAAIKELPNLSSLKCASCRVPYPDSYPFRQVSGIGRRHQHAHVLVVDLPLPACHSLNNNRFGEQGAVVLAKVMPECKALVSLR